MLDLNTLDFAKGDGLVTVVTQDDATSAVLMVAYADREALERTLATGEMHYRSRSRGLWHKGATSGNVQRVVGLASDCDRDAVLARVVPAGPACHTGATTCFDAPPAVDAAAESGDHLSPSGDVLDGAAVLRALDVTIARRAAEMRAVNGHTAADQGRTVTADPAPRPSYTVRLLGDRNLRLKKLGEEAAELAVACADEDTPRAAEEAGDIIYHTLVALRALGLGLDDVAAVLVRRAR